MSSLNFFDVKGVLARICFIFALALIIFPSSVSANEDPRLDIQNITTSGDTLYLDATISNIGDKTASIYKIDIYSLTIVDRLNGKIVWKGAPVFDNLNIRVAPGALVNETLKINNVSLPYHSYKLKWELSYSIFTN